MQRRTLATLALLAGSVAGLPAQAPLYRLNGDAPGHRLGASVVGIGDANGDGIPDFVVGAPGADTRGPGSGRASLFSGADGSLLRQWNGPNPGDALGASVAAVGDANGDGRADILVGSPGTDKGGPDAGAAWLFSGATGLVLRVWNGAAGDGFGSSVGGAGQVNRNGYADVIVGAQNANYARVFEGRNGNLLFHIAPAANPQDAFGAAVSGAGDVNGDGFGDVAIGAPGDDVNGVDSGMVLVVSGFDGSILQTLRGDDAGDALGTSLSFAGDIDNDGTPDFIAGAPGDDNKGTDSGSARVFSGTGSTIYTFDGDFAGDAMGTSVAGAFDANGDGTPDVLAGAPGNDWGGSNAGAARVLSGSDGTILATWRGNGEGDAFGTAVSSVGDASGDGYADIIAGAPGDDDNGAEAGSARVIARAPYDTLILTRVLTPAGSPGLFGNDNELVGDVDNDGVADYAIGAVSDFGEQGIVRVFSGADHSIIHAFAGGTNNIFFGPSIAGAGDVNGDGHADVLTGAQHWDNGGGFNGRATLRSGLDGSTLHEWFGVQNNAHMGSALGGLGDIDGDGVPDVLVGLLKQDPGTAPGTGAVRTYSGATGEMIWEVYGSGKGDWFSSAGEDLGDIDGDGICDFVTGAPQAASGPPTLPGYASVLSGADGSEIYRFNGLDLGDIFGGSSSRAGDVNGDGVMDILVGAYGHDPQGKISAGMARVFSGADGSLLYHFEGENAGDSFGQFVNDAGDVNGDGFDDFLIGAPGYDPNGVIAAGRAYLFSGLDGSVLQLLDGTMILQQFGRALSGIGDVNGDGYADIDIAAPQDPTAGPQSGAAYVFESRVKTDPGTATPFGASCNTFYSWLPLLTVTGRPAIGGTYNVHLNPLFNELGAAGLLRTGDSNTALSGGAPLPMTLEAALGCTIYINNITTESFVPSLAGVTLPQSVPNDPSLIGTTLYHQILVADPHVNALRRVFTNAVEIKVGK